METKTITANAKIMHLGCKVGIDGYCKCISEPLKNGNEVNETACVGPEADTGIIKANAHDICNYVARYYMANSQIQAIMKLDGKLDFDRLAKAVRLSVEAEPVLGCRLVKRSKPYWKRCDNFENVKFCFFEETDNVDEAVQRFLQEPLDLANGPMLRVKLIRSNEYDTLGIKINHACSDAAGARDYIHLLSEIYCHMEQASYDFIPKPKIRGKKEDYLLLEALKNINSETAWGPQDLVTFPTWDFPWRNLKLGSTDFVICRLPEGYLDVMKNYGKARGATINDLILTAIYRAMFELCNPPCNIPMDIPITIDLRRFLPDKKADAIRNFSGGYVARIARKAGEPFEGTLSRVMSVTKIIKSSHPRAEIYRWAEFIEKMNFRWICSYFKTEGKIFEMASYNPFFVIKKCVLTLSNFGFISKSLIKFGERVVTDAYIIPPVVRAPGILLVASTYNGVITLGVGYYKPSVKRIHMETLLNKIRDELVEGCR